MEQETIIQLQQKIISTPKTIEDLKIINQLIKITQFFPKLSELYHQQLLIEGQLKLCNLLELKSYTFSELIIPSNKYFLQVLLKGKLYAYQKQEGYIYQQEKFLTKLAPLSFLQDIQDNQLFFRVESNDVFILMINKKDTDEIFKFFGDLFINKQKTLCKIIPGLSELNSKRIQEAIAIQFENITYPHGTHITVENSIGEYIYFLANGVVEFQKKNEYQFNMEESGIIGDELILDPDEQDQNQLIEYSYTATVKSAQVLLYRIKLKIFQRLFPNAIIRAIIILFKQKQSMRNIYATKTIVPQKFLTSPNNEGKINNNNKKKLILSKKEIQSYDKIDPKFQQYQVPKYSRVLKFNKDKMDRYQKKQNQGIQKITINEFVKLTKKNDVPQMQLLEKVENPYDFASNVNAEGFLKQYYSNLIRVGLVKPPMRIEPQNQELIARSRLLSAIKLIESTKNELKPRRTTSAFFGNTDPLLQISSLINVDDKTTITKQPNKTITTTILPTPRTQSQPHIQNNSNRHSLWIETPKCETPYTRSTMPRSAQPIFRPYSGFMDHSSRITQQSEIHRRRRTPNQNY